MNLHCNILSFAYVLNKLLNFLNGFHAKYTYPFFSFTLLLSKERTNLPSFALYFGILGLPKYLLGYFVQSLMATKNDFHILSRILNVPCPTLLPISLYGLDSFTN